VVNTSLGIYVRGRASFQRGQTESLQLSFCFNDGYSSLLFSRSKQICSRIWS